MKISPDERIIQGEWVFADGEMVGDQNCIRIRSLTESYLREVTRSVSGWEVLFVDPADNRYWELRYPRGEMHGGGPPELACLSADEVLRKYGSRNHGPGL